MDAGPQDAATPPADAGQSTRDAGPPTDTGTAPADAGTPPNDAGLVAMGLVDTQPILIESCTSLPSACDQNSGPDCGKCQYRVMHDAHCSKARPCDNLLLYWANFGCQDEGFARAMTRLVAASPDFIVACVQPLLPGEILPVTLGAPERDQAVVPQVLARLRDANDLGVWTGKNLLMGGCSAGASRYPVVAARYSEDDNWLGTDKNAACMSDGVVDIVAQDRFVGEGVRLGGQSCAGRHGRIVSAYTLDTPMPGHRCESSPGAQCACDAAHTFRSHPGDCGDGDCVIFDSIVGQNQSGTYGFSAGVSPQDFAIDSWRLISEGSDWESERERCEQDVVPEGPYRALCGLIDAAPNHRCEHVSQPSAGHCAYYNANLKTACLDWFRDL